MLETSKYSVIKIFKLNLISDFFPTLRTILEVSVNLKRIFFEGEGVGVLEYSDPKWHWSAPFATSESQRNYGGGPLDPPDGGCFIWGSFNKHMHTLPSSALRTFRLFSRNPF